MARIRYLKPEFFLDDDIAELTYVERLFFQGLWCHADKAGRLEDKSKVLKVQILPYDDIDPEKILARLDGKFIVRYEVDGRKYLQVKNFLKHQRPHKTEKDSILPPPNGSLTVKEPLNNGLLTVKEPLSNSYKEKEKEKEKEKGKKRRSKPRPVFRNPPTEDECTKYAEANEMIIDVAYFWRFYDSKGWTNAGGEPMLNWKSTMQTWNKRAQDEKTKEVDKNQGHSGFQY